MKTTNFFKATLRRLKTKSPKYFNYIQYTIGAIFAIMAGYISFSTELGISIPFFEKYATEGTTFFVFISWFISLLPEDSKLSLLNTDNMQVFDNLNLNHSVINIDGSAINPVAAGQLPTVNTMFNVTNGLLYANTTNTVVLELLDGAGKSYFSSSRPVRK